MMIFSVAKIISYLSEFMTLEPGDIVTIGTLSGVGMKPPIFLKPGDVMRLGVEKPGVQSRRVLDWQRCRRKEEVLF